MHAGNDPASLIHDHDGINRRILEDSVHHGQHLRRIFRLDRPDHIRIGGQHQRFGFHVLFRLFQQVVQPFNSGAGLFLSG